LRVSSPESLPPICGGLQLEAGAASAIGAGAGFGLRGADFFAAFLAGAAFLADFFAAFLATCFAPFFFLATTFLAFLDFFAFDFFFDFLAIQHSPVAADPDTTQAFFD
jgi:hypothetical protein